MTKPDGLTYVERRAKTFWAGVDKSASCWLWLRSTDHGGYGRTKWRDIGTGAHRVAYLLTHGEIPDGLEIDHLCRNKTCVNPAHLEAVTHIENMRRTPEATKAFCKRGHALFGANLYRRPDGARVCITCRDMRARQKLAALAPATSKETP